MAATADQVKQAMPFTTRYPELGTGPVDVKPLYETMLPVLDQVLDYLDRYQQGAIPESALPSIIWRWPLLKPRPITKCMVAVIRSRTALTPTVSWPPMGK